MDKKLKEALEREMRCASLAVSELPSWMQRLGGIKKPKQSPSALLIIELKARVKQQEDVLKEIQRLSYSGYGGETRADLLKVLQKIRTLIPSDKE